MRWVQPKNTEHIRRALHQISTVKTWQLLVILLLGLLVAATLLRLNNLGMVDRRQAVIAADEKGDDEAVKRALVELQRYVSSHMNTSLDKGVYRVAAYERDRDTALTAAASSTNPQSEVYKQASVECRSRFQGGVESFRNDYVTCVLDRVSALQSSSDPAAGADLPIADNYRYDYVSPAWTPDLAGLVVLFCAVITGVIVIRFIALGVLHLMLKHRYRSI
jgi:hypothetical protein